MTIDISRTRRRFVLDEGVAILSRTPATLDAMLRGLPDGWIHGNEGDATWSARDVVGHLIHGERVDWMPRVRVILDHGDTQTFTTVDRLAQFTAFQGRTLDSLLDEFAAARQESLDQLAALALTTGDYERRGRHPAFGPVTLGQLLATWVAHDLDHIVQISRVMARQYSDAVGPWSAYLRIINGAQV